MPTPDYKKLDEAILANVTIGAQKFNKINTTVVSLLAAAADPKAEPFRVVDRRLQALRKAKKLCWDRKNGWTLPGPAQAVA